MGKHSIILGLLMIALAPIPAVAAPFSPEPLKINAPSIVQFGFDDEPIAIPLTLEGGPATVTLALFTKDRGAGIRNVRSGRLGWHYVNGIDTCIYLSASKSYESGMNTITWDGRDNDGRLVPLGDYTYYLLGVGSESNAGRACADPRFFRFDRSTVVMYDGQGNPLANPVLFSAAQSSAASGETWNTRARWPLGGDPNDLSLIETTRYRSRPDRGLMAMDPGNSRFFYTQALEPGAMVTRAWEWTPNGDAVLRSYWGDNGRASVPSALDPETSPYSGPVIGNGSYLFSVNLFSENTRSFPALAVVDINDGTYVRSFDLSPWFGEDVTPSGISIRNSQCLLSSPELALFQMIDPIAGFDDETRFPLWGNGIGDGFADTLPASGEPRGTAVDQRGFAFFSGDGSSSSVGMLTPDGTGAGLFPLPGMTTGAVTGIGVIDSGSLFDGLYYGSSIPEGNGAGVQYTGYDVFKGVLASYIDIFGPPVYFAFDLPYAPREPLKPGAIFTISWEYYWREPITEPVRISVSFDDRRTWTVLADSAASKGSLDWTVPAISSSACWLSLTGVNQNEPWDMRGPFAIDGTVAVSGDTPRPLMLRPNTPNPFNPSTTISFTLPIPEDISLTVFDVLGHKVAELERGRFAAGEHASVWNAPGCASGVYFCVLKAGNAVETRKMLLVR